VCVSAQQVDGDFRVTVGNATDFAKIDRPSKKFSFFRYPDGPGTLITLEDDFRVSVGFTTEDAKIDRPSKIFFGFGLPICPCL
jgi:hypothetical protein